MQRRNTRFVETLVAALVARREREEPASDRRRSGRPARTPEVQGRFQRAPAGAHRTPENEPSADS
jgi:hypothetical protein